MDSDYGTALWEDEINPDPAEIPAWIDPEYANGNDIAAIVQGGCESGAYMPAVTYWQALQTMNEHGDDVLQYIDDVGCTVDGADLVPMSWAGMACHLLSMAVEIWAHSTYAELEAKHESLQA